MDKIRSLAIIFLVLLALIPAWYVNGWIQRLVRPRDSFLRFITYMLIMFVFIFAFTFLVVFTIRQLFPLPLK